jgi:hypothetical protein
MTRLRTALALCAALFLSACLPVTSTAPAGSTAGFKNDPVLSGIWKGKPEDADDSSYFVFLPKGDDTISALLVITKPGDAGWMAFSLQTTELGGRRFINAKETAQDGQAADESLSKNSIPFFYSFANNKLTLYTIDEDAAKAAISAGKLEGRIEPGTYGDVVITASGEKFDKFLQSKAGKALFTKPFAILTKVE